MKTESQIPIYFTEMVISRKVKEKKGTAVLGLTLTEKRLVNE